MTARKRRKHVDETSKDAVMNMTPMIDVVFLLIIFFLVSSHLAKQEAQMELPLPTADSGQTPADESVRVTVNVLADGSVRLAGRETPVDRLRERLAQKRDEEGDALEVRIRTDQNLPYRLFEPVMVACAEANIWNVTIAVHRRQDVGR